MKRIIKIFKKQLNNIIKYFPIVYLLVLLFTVDLQITIYTAIVVISASLIVCVINTIIAMIYEKYE